MKWQINIKEKCLRITVVKRLPRPYNPITTTSDADISILYVLHDSCLDVYILYIHEYAKLCKETEKKLFNLILTSIIMRTMYGDKL